MLTDGYVEEICDGKTPKSVYLTIVGGIFLVLAGIAAMITTLFGITIIFIGVVLICVGISNRNVEYEYEIVNEDVDIARITGKEKRKQVYKFNNGDVKMVAKSNSIFINNEFEAASNIKVKDFTSGNDAQGDKTYVFILNRNNGTEAVMLELGENAVNHVKLFFKGKMRE